MPAVWLDNAVIPLLVAGGGEFQKCCKILYDASLLICFLSHEKGGGAAGSAVGMPGRITTYADPGQNLATGGVHFLGFMEAKQK